MSLAQDKPSVGDVKWWSNLVDLNSVVGFLTSKIGGFLVAALILTFLVRWAWKDAKIRMVTVAVLTGFVVYWLVKNGAFR